MSASKSRANDSNTGWMHHPGAHLGLMAVVLGLLFSDSFKAGHTMFSNDSPLGGLVAQWDYLVQNLTGIWQPLNWFGGEAVSNRPTLSFMIGSLMSAVLYQKFFAPIALWILGASAWFCCRQLGFRAPVCLLAGFAAMLNMSGFSNACWGLPYWMITRAMAYLAVGFIASSWIPRPWMRYVLAGFCIGMGVMEGYDIGAIFSVFVAVVIFARLLCESDEPASMRIAKGVSAVMIMALAAVILATHAVVSLINTQVKGVAGTAQEQQTKEQRWDYATQWSLPKKEVLRFVIPGVFGYRMDEADGGKYWGSVGENPQLDELRRQAEGNPQMAAMLNNVSLYRYSGSGEHAGVIVVFFALWAILQSFRRTGTSFSVAERRWIWCLAVLACGALLLAFGRHAPFYRIFYELPYASTIRNPIKFTHPMHFAVVILFAYGVNDLWRRFVDRAEAGEARDAPIRKWLGTLPAFDQRWLYGTAGAVGVAVFGLALYVAKRNSVEAYLGATGFATGEIAGIVEFSYVECAFFVFYLAATAVVFFLFQRGTFARQGAWGLVLLLAILTLDLGRSNAYWIRHVNYRDKYADNAVFKALSERPFEHRVTIAPNPGVPAMQVLEQVYRVNWLHQQFQYYRIHALDISQEARVGEDKTKYLQALQPAMPRYWELANVRYLLGLNNVPTQQGNLKFTDLLNQQLDPVKKRFQVKLAFTLFQEPGSPDVKVREDANGPFALIEFTGALPRATVYHQWETITDDNAALNRLKDPQFQPDNTLILAESPSLTPAATTTRGTAKITTYEPKRVVIEVSSPGSGMLLLNDRFHPDWHAYVDGQRVPVLRANYIARAVPVGPDTKQVEFRFEPPVNTLYVSLLGVFAAFGLTAFVVLRRRSTDQQAG